jgi:uncharacterized protein HemX
MTEQDPGLRETQPAVEVPAGQPGIYQPVADSPAAPRPPRRSAVLPAVLAVVMFLAAGAFVALWLTERDNHKTTTSQLGETRTEIADVEKKTGAAQTAYTDAETRLKESEKGLADKKAEADRNKPCMEASQEFMKAVLVNDPRAGEVAGFLVVERCK